MAPIEDNDSGMESQSQEGSMGSVKEEEEIGATEPDPESEKPPQTQQPEIEGSYDDEVHLKQQQDNNFC